MSPLPFSIILYLYLYAYPCIWVFVFQKLSYIIFNFKKHVRWKSSVLSENVSISFLSHSNCVCYSYHCICENYHKNIQILYLLWISIILSHIYYAKYFIFMMQYLHFLFQLYYYLFLCLQLYLWKFPHKFSNFNIFTLIFIIA